jgi:hypothetical protein
VTLQGWLDLHLVDRIAVEDLVVGNQSAARAILRVDFAVMK